MDTDRATLTKACARRGLTFHDHGLPIGPGWMTIWVRETPGSDPTMAVLRNDGGLTIYTQRDPKIEPLLEDIPFD